MGKKNYRFRKMYFICTDNLVIKPDTRMTNAYQFREDAEALIENRITHFMWEDKTKPVPQRKVEAFYLVHESLFNEILASFESK